MDRITRQNLTVSAEQINRILSELGVNIDASIYGAYGGVQLEGFSGSHKFSLGIRTKRELYDQLRTVTQVLYEVSRQLRQKESVA